ncbi:hypothetical protein [Tamaricihabitans halophyticus]|uniref:hypothetical protein n=1 Tax=Tamaricihabitans halophyticus TaxID=1262583 RepID=UPI001051097D|nr:hypothetical protein [Tamaricihabitans halophyticus]
MRQLSMFSAEVYPASVDDLAGVLCGHGQLVSFGRTAARLSVVVDAEWRARLLAEECALRGVAVELTHSEEGHPLLRTAFRADLIALANAWTRGAVKAVPTGLRLDGQTLRLWALSGGDWSHAGYLLPLDPRAPDTHEPLAELLTDTGLRASQIGIRAGGPGLRLTGRGRLARLAELIGPAPEPAALHWPLRSTA